ncbi:MAG: hypothetical protein V4659_04455 [Pseudomonadota bacterium]
MNGGSRIIDLRGRPLGDALLVDDAPTPLELTDSYDQPVRSHLGVALATLAVTASVAWIATITWLGWPQLASGNALNIASFAALVTMPLALVGIIWLLAMRTSRAEAQRFGASARAMRAESERLETAISSMARRLEESRAALQDQTNTMLALGENAAMRIAAVGAGVGEHAASIEASATRLDTATAHAGQELGKLLTALPDARAQAEGMANAIEGTGMAAADHVAALDQRLEAVIERGQSARSFADDAVQALGDRLTLIANEGDRANSSIVTVEQNVERVTAGLMDADARLATLHEIGVDRAQQLAASISALGGSADAMTEAMRTGDATAREMIATAEQALVSVDAVAREIDDTLPEALARLDARIGESRAVVGAAKPELLALVTAAQSTHEAIEAIAGVIAEQRTTLDDLSGNLAETLTNSRAKADALGVVMEESIGRAQSFARDAAPQLVDALLRVRDTANTAADRAREALAVVIPEAAAALESSSTAALKRATANSVERQVAALAEAAEVAVEAAQRASDRLTRQLVTIADTTAAVEARIDAAREERAEAEEDGIARHSAQLIEALNSAAIDLGDALATETSDSAWAAYLKGDRGVFTRRAVRLLDNGAARDIAALYNADPGFRDRVNRYIHDFEAMLRGVLASREGSPLGVTLLSSDMGKLYVALAQAIERLRA